MARMKVSLLFLFTAFYAVSPAQVSIRIFSDKSPESVVFSVTEGSYEVDFLNGERVAVPAGNSVILTKYGEKLAVKAAGAKAYICDSVMLKAETGRDLFSIRITGAAPVKQSYSGDLKCFPDLGTILLINICDVEKYIEGVVEAEGGNGKFHEYFQTQAVIARTYMYKYFHKHWHDRYNLCDNTHCQAYKGVASDSLIVRAARSTLGEVILASDSTLITSAFHSNCGGETVSSGDVWLSGMPYLKSVKDPYCLTSRNARWEKTLTRSEWLDYLKNNGFTETPDNRAATTFVQLSRQSHFRSGSFSLPLSNIRADLNLRSTFFSVTSSGESVILNGKGYGHGVGLCQEGAMAMAARGFTYRQIIDFYYTGIFVADIKDAVLLSDTEPDPVKNIEAFDSGSHYIDSHSIKQ